MNRIYLNNILGYYPSRQHKEISLYYANTQKLGSYKNGMDRIKHLFLGFLNRIAYGKLTLLTRYACKLLEPAFKLSSAFFKLIFKKSS